MSRLSNATLIRTNQLDAKQRHIVALVVNKILSRLIL